MSMDSLANAPPDRLSYDSVIQIKGEGLTKTFTVRKISNGIGVERIFPLSSPAIDGLTIVKHGKVRRSRLFYLRDRVGKKARIKERRVK